MSSLDNISGPESLPSGLQSTSGGILSITPAAAERIIHLLGQKNPQPEAVLVSVTTKGCSGMRYDLQYLDKLADKPKFADAITQHGVTVVVDPKATLYIVGSIMDYKQGAINSGFDFTNPNETGRCGCGESFSVAPSKN